MASRSQRRAVLVLEADRGAVGVGAGGPAGVGEQQQGEQAVGLGRVGKQLDDESGEADRLFAEVGSHQLVAGGGDVALGVDEVQDVQDAAEPFGQVLVGGHAVGDAGRLHLALGPHEPLVHRRLGGEEGPGDLGHLEAADGAEGEGHPGIEGEGGVTAREEQAEPVVGDAAAVVAVLVGWRGVVVVAHECFEVLEGGLVGGAGAAAAEGVDRPPSGDGRQPAAGPGGDAAGRPLRRRGGEGVGDGFLGEADVAAHLAGERREERGPLLAVRPLDGQVRGGDVRRVRQRLRRPARGRTGVGPRRIRRSTFGIRLAQPRAASRSATSMMM